MELTKRTVPPATAEQREELIRRLAVAVFNEMSVDMSVREGWGSYTLRGKIAGIDRHARSILVDALGGPCWVGFDDVLSIRFI